MKLDIAVAKQKIQALIMQNKRMEADLQYNRAMIARWKNTNIKHGNLEKNKSPRSLNTAAMGTLKMWRKGLQMAEPALRRKMMLNRAELIILKEFTRGA